MMARRIAAALMVAVSVVGSSWAGQPAQTNRDEEITLVAQGNNDFAIRLYRRLQGNEGNLFFSPYSISTALAMAYAGARGRPQEQMAEALGYPTSRPVAQAVGRSHTGDGRVLITAFVRQNSSEH